MNSLKMAALLAQKAVNSTVEAGTQFVASSVDDAKKSALETIDELGSVAARAGTVAADSVASGTRRMLDGVAGVADSAVDGVSDAANRAQRAVSRSVESGTRRMLDGALDAKDAALGGIAKTVGNTWGAATDVLHFPILGELIGIGVTVGLITAPVPVAIGVGILMLVDMQMKERQQQIQDHVDESIQRRTRDRVVGMIQKYGEIPETAIIETPMAKVHLCSSKGTITGVVKTGPYQGQKIEEIDHHGLFQLIQSCGDDQESRQVLESIESIRIKNLQRAISQ